MILAHKIKLKPNKHQEVLLNKACGVARYTYNWALAEWQNQYQQGLKPNHFELKKQWNQVKPEWVYESPKDANQQPFVNLNKAFQRFFKKKASFPKYKKKGRCDSFYVSNDLFEFNGNKVRLPKIGLVKLTEQLRFKGKIISATISKKANQFFISTQVEVNEFKKRVSNEHTGIDVGLTNAITLSNGKKYFAPKPFKDQKVKIARLQRRLSRKKKGSSNYKKQKIKLQRAHLKLTNIRNDFWHKMTSMLCSENQVICIEDLSIKNMIKNRKLSFSLADVGLGEFFRQLDYKKLVWNNIVVKVNMWFPSTQICFNCKNKKKVKLSERIYRCEHCGYEKCRDVNAAMNIYTEGYSEIDACGQLASGS